MAGVSSKGKKKNQKTTNPKPNSCGGEEVNREWLPIVSSSMGIRGIKLK